MYARCKNQLQGKLSIGAIFRAHRSLSVLISFFGGSTAYDGSSARLRQEHHERKQLEMDKHRG